MKLMMILFTACAAVGLSAESGASPSWESGLATGRERILVEAGALREIRDSTQVKCSSEGYRYRTCGTGHRYAQVVLETQLSRSPCIEGQSWGSWDSTIWVDKGCSAIFRVYPGRETHVDCASHRYRRSSCGTGMWNIRVVGVSQRSDTACIQGDTWGHDNTNIWVDRGCRAIFHIVGFPFIAY